MMKPEQELSAFSELRGSDGAEYLGLEGHLQHKRSKSNSGLLSFLYFLRRNWFLIALPTLSFAAIAAYLVYQTPNTYIGDFQLQVEPVTSPEGLLPNASGEASPTQNPLDYETLTRLLVSPKLLEALPVLENPNFNLSQEELQAGLTVRRIGQNQSQDKQTKLIQVAYENQDADKILWVLEELKKHYLKFGNDERQKSLGGGIEFIEKQLPEVRQRVTLLESQLQKLQQQYRVSDLDGEGAALAKRSRELEAQRQEIQPRLQAQEQLKTNLEQQLKLTPNQVIAASQITENPNIQAFSGQLQKIEAEIATLSAVVTDNNPRLIELQEQRRNLDTALRKETQAVIGPSLPQGNSAVVPPKPQSDLQKQLGEQLIGTINEIQVLNIQNQALNQASIAIDQKLQQFPVVKRQYDDIKGKLEIDRTMLNNLLLKREEFRVQIAQKEVPWQIISNPKLLKDDRGNLISTTDRGVQKIGLAALGGLLLGLGASVLKEKRQNVFYSLNDLKNAVDLNLYGVIPLDKELKAVSKSMAMVPSESDEEALLQYGYPLRLLQSAETLYANLKSRVEAQASQALVIGSVTGGDGKTVLAINLAKAVSSTGQRVLLVDANLAFPLIHSRFGLPNYEGLSDVLAQDIDPNQLIQRSPLHSSLFILTAGQMSRKANKLLASNQMALLMERLQNMFDLVIYDTPNLQSSSGANFLALNAQGLLLVVGLKKTKRSQFLNTLERLRNSRVPVVGMVANFVTEALPDLEELPPEDFDFRSVQSESDLEDEFEIFRVRDQAK